MRHNVAHRKLGRVTEHRISLLRNQAVALIRHERIQTTVPKAKELKSFVERIISVAKRSLDAPEGSTRHVTARRTVARDIADRAGVKKLFDTIAPRYTGRPGGYTRLLRLGHRRGDAAEMASIELVGSEFNPDAVVEGANAEAEKPKKKGVGGRLRDALGARGAKKPDADTGGKGRVEKAAKGAGRKVSTPRKSGGA
jgi:large subunit ribosomal protein L17